MDSNRFQDRVVYLEEREKRLEKETHELREQNELLEFRILELEENQDKVKCLKILIFHSQFYVFLKLLNSSSCLLFYC
jgi:hypothetical protein